jgi:glycosyltransferase involved in cell wall biosynthesis
VYLFRGGGPQLFVAAAFCRVHRRRLVFSAAIDLDFDFARRDRGRLNLWMHRTGLKRADLIVAQRDQQAEIARGAGDAPVEVIPSFARPEPATTSEGEAFLWIGRVVDYKRPLEFLEVVRSVPEARFRMITFINVETPPVLAAAVHDAERLPNFELLGQLKHADALDQIGRAVAIVSTSAAEGMPNVFLEAWARGVPVLSLDYDPDGKIEAVGMGKVAGGSVERLGELAGELWRDRGLRSELGAAGRHYVREAHSPETVGARWRALLEPLARD